MIVPGVMPFYVYETIPAAPGAPVRRYEFWQHMKESAYTRHPETGEPLRRIIIGGVGMPGSISDPKADTPRGPRVKPAH